MTTPFSMPESYWQDYLDKRLELTKQVLGAKSAEYAAGSKDKLHNFNVALEISPELKTREDALMGMARKHWVSIQDMLGNLREGIVPTSALVREKFGDWINYMLLLEASILQTIDKDNGFLNDDGTVSDLPF